MWVFVLFLSEDRAPVSAVSNIDQAVPVERVILNIPDGPVMMYLYLIG
jgi:hypothetical protein